MAEPDHDHDAPRVPEELVADVTARIAAGTLQIIIDEDGNVTFSDLPADLIDLVKELTDDPAMLSRFCNVPSPPAPLPRRKRGE